MALRNNFFVKRHDTMIPLQREKALPSTDLMPVKTAPYDSGPRVTKFFHLSRTDRRT